MRRKKREGRAVSRLFGYNKKERPILFIAFIANLASGVTFPIMSILMSHMLAIFSIRGPNFRQQADQYSLYFLVLGICSFFANAISNFLLGYNGEILTLKLRVDLFTKIIKMPIGWHDLPENTPGSLTTKLSNDCITVNTLAGTTIGTTLQAMSSLITGIVIAFTASWQLSLCNLAFMPIIAFAMKIQQGVARGWGKREDTAFTESGGFVADCVINMRTVASFGKEENMIKAYEQRMEIQSKKAYKKGHLTGLAVGFSQCLVFLQNAYLYYLGAIFTKDVGLQYADVFQSIYALFFSVMGLAQAMNFIPDVGKGKMAAVDLFNILDSKPEIDIDDPIQNVKNPITGDIEFKNVWFKYPTRERQVLRGLNIKIDSATKTALVGSSGCGKSTVIALLMRFYDPQAGEITIGGVDIKKYDLQHLRRSFGMVSQEPALFNDSIEGNIRYGKMEATIEEIRSAASEANALKFIEANDFEGVTNDVPEQEKGFNRKVGPKGSQISGGQKQRIAIARAIINKPYVLLLDEATSALDTENEKIVQVSLEHVMKEKTSIVVAHRISTIKDSKVIYVFDEGRVTEQGTYDELNQLQGLFYKLERGIDV